MFRSTHFRPCRSRLILRAPLVLLLSLMLSGAAFARRGEPPKSRLPEVWPMAALEVFALPPVDAEALKAQDSLASKPGPLRVAVPVEVRITPQTHGVWEPLADGGRLWRLRFHSHGATDLNFGFTRYRLPADASLHVLSESEDYYEGPYTHLDNKDHGQLWTPVVPGDRALIELYLPPRAEHQPVLELTRVGTGYRNLLRSFDLSAAKDSHGACNIDVVCPVGDPWRDEIRSVAWLLIGGTGICTGTLIADVPRSLRPFILSANHCGVIAQNAPSIVVVWNFQSPTCGQLGGGSMADTQTGSTFRASREDVDVLLFELDAPPDPSFGVHYAGWDRSGAAATGSVGIHHPSGEVKSISFNDDMLFSATTCIAGASSPSSHWIVNDWETGTTEPGSSGSGLWDPQTKKVVGFLSGGSASCQNPGGFDCYGKFSVGWDGATAASRLRDWLDPDNTGTMMIDGFDPGAGSSCTPDATTLCIDNALNPGDRRFRVTMSFETTQGGGRMGDALAIPLTAVGITKGGLFAFSDPQNPEVLVKVLNGCNSAVPHFWVFYAPTTNFGFELTVFDTLRGQSVSYVNPDRNVAPSVGDTRALATCP